ncbi:snf2 family N-terminal domain-containing protein [Cyclospora cayetanensis]|uniref:Snf2 family N-terminal domain-containing protein n=1 Tax=Cyclospora cayetanensis TaxID=88456 RepID=A0A1D3CWB2_9EIME|nr:snf2 family N-terminal domain-containing protein [Cyclospora cayetanensis]
MFYEIYGGEGPPGRPDIPPSADTPESCVEQQQRRASPPDSDVCPSHSGESAATVIPGPQWRPRRAGASRGVRRLPVGAALARGKLRVGGARNKRNRESPEATESEAKVSDETSEESADTSDSEEETESSEQASSGSSDEEGDASGSKRLWQPSKAYSAAAKAALLKERDPWFAACAVDGDFSNDSENEEPLMDVVDKVEEALEVAANCAVSAATANDAPAVDARRKSVQSPFYVKVRSELEKIQELQTKPVKLQQQGAHEEQVSHCVLHDYQTEGAAWILQRFAAHLNCIVADDMGLGKTLQALAVYLHLCRFGGSAFAGKPAIVVCPLSVISSWEVAAPTAAPFDILLTSYELAAREMSFVSSFCFSLLIADEASRLKGPHGVKRRLLAEGIKRQRTLLLTGTPIENSLLELFSLLSFLHPSIFSSAEAFTSLFYAECENRLPGSKASLASSPNRNCQLLERVVSAFVLRRTVMQAQHCWQLPPLREVILMLPLTPVQRRLYLWLLTRDAQLLLSSSRDSDCGASDIIKGIRNLNNLYMQLRKASNHPLLFARKQSDTLPFMQASSAAASGPRNATAPKSPSEFSTDDEEEDFCYEELLLSASNKLQALHRIVSLCISRGEKLVIYSHSTKMLDITEDLLLESGIRPARLDGDTPDAGRRAAIEAFLKPPPTTQKSDDDEGTEWTPMGQTRPVVAIRLISKHTVEEVLYRRGNAKLHLSSVVLGAAEAAATPRGTAGAKEASATAAADPLRSLQAFDCGALLTSNAADNGNLEHDAPQKQHSQLAKSLRSDGKYGADKANVLESFPIEAILTDALSTAAAGAAPSAGVLPAATVSSSSPGASPPLLSSPPASAPAAHVVEVQSQDDRAKSPPAGDNIYVFEQKDFTPFVRADRRQEDDVTALESLAMANARAPPDTGTPGCRRKLQKRDACVYSVVSWLQHQRVFRLERLWESQGYMSHALRFSGETDPRYIWGLDASGAAEATASGSPEGKTPTEPRRQIPAETFFVFPSLCDKEDSSDALPTKNSRPKGSSSYCHQRIGDATCPQSVLGAPPGPQVICLFVETGGRWLSRGFFAAIDRLSSEPRKVFTQAHKCRDVRGGDVHLVKIREGLFVALAVCINEENRNRKGGGGFFVRVRDMMRCLDLLSLHCKMNAASLHLPRCNTPCRYSADANTNSLTTNALVFRLLQETFARRKVHALTYILPRRGNPADNVGCRNGVGRTSSIPSADTGVPPKTALVRSALGPCAAERGSNGSVGSPEGDGDCCASGATQVQATKQKAPKGWCALRKKQRADAQTKQQPQPTQHGLTQKKSPQLQVKQEQQQAWKVPQRGEQTQPVSREPALSGSSSTAGGSAQSSSERSKADKNEEVLELTREAVEMDVLHAAFGRLVASLAAVVETDEQLSQMARAWGVQQVLVQLPAATGGESFSKCTPTFPANEPGSWEQICHEAKRWMRAEACEAAAMASSLERTPISLLGGPTERVIPSNLRLALFAWENANHAKQRPPTERSKVVPSDPLLFYGVQ